MLNYIFLSLFFFFSFLSWGQSSEIKNLYVLSIESSINPATFEYIQNAYNKASQDDSSAVLIKMNTPGGLVNITKKIITTIGDASFPTIIWITPEGASATSAGAIIASSAHFLFASPATNIGAATPINLSGDIDKKDVRGKAINDLVALVTSLSESRGRSQKPFEEMISLAKSFTAKEALKNKAINGIVHNLDDIKKFLQGKNTAIHGKEFIFNFNDSLVIKVIKPTLFQTLLDQLANPSTAYILFLLGVALLYLEFQAPGGFLAGSIGAICLVIAAIGFQIISLNMGALALVILSIILFILEVYITSYGILTIGAIAALSFGSLYLFESESSYLGIEKKLIFSGILGVVLFILFVGYFLWKTRKVKKISDQFFEHIGKTAFVIAIKDSFDKANYHYQIRVSGEIWNAISSSLFEVGEEVFIDKYSTDELTLVIKRRHI